MPFLDKPAFRCRGCGHLHGAEHAGDRKVPTACPACGAGINFKPKGGYDHDPANWEVLAEGTPERLAELGLTADGVARHEPSKAGPTSGRKIDVSVEDSVLTKDRG